LRSPSAALLLGACGTSRESVPIYTITQGCAAKCESAYLVCLRARPGNGDPCFEAAMSRAGTATATAGRDVSSGATRVPTEPQ